MDLVFVRVINQTGAQIVPPEQQPPEGWAQDLTFVPLGPGAKSELTSIGVAGEASSIDSEYRLSWSPGELMMQIEYVSNSGTYFFRDLPGATWTIVDEGPLYVHVLTLTLTATRTA